MSNVNVYSQRPADIAGQSPLHHAGLHELVGKGRKNAGITLREKKLRGHLVIRGDAKDAGFSGGVHKALGLELPVALTLVADGDTSLQWLGPDEWLLIVPGGSGSRSSAGCAKRWMASISRWSTSAADRPCWSCPGRRYVSC